MKAKFIFSTLIFISLLFLSGNYFSVKEKTENTNKRNTQTYNLSGKFLIAAMHSGFDNTADAYKRLSDTLKINSWHKYGSWFDGDTIDADSNKIAAGVTNRVSQNDIRDIRTVFHRPVTAFAAYGQRSDYQCENISYGADYWFYAYNNSITNTYVSDVSDSGGIVKHASLNAGSPGVWEGYLVKNLRSNREQCNKKIGHLLDNKYQWYLRPRMRIPTGLNDTIKVCRIEIVDWNDTLRKSVELTADNFNTITIPYNGQYMDQFYFLTNNYLSSIKIDTNDICPGSAKDPYSWKNDPMKTDYRVYWYGQCDLWIDYIRLEDEPARRLYEGELNAQINAEVNYAKANYNPDHPNYFYQEEFEFNHSPCIKEVNRIIETAPGSDLTFMVNLNVELYNTVVPYYYDSSRFFYADDFRKYLVDYANIKILIPTTYDLDGGTDTYLYPNNLKSRASLSPNTLPVYSQPGNSNLSYDPSKGLLAYTTNPSEYDDWIQYRFDNVQDYNWKFTNIFKLCDTIADRSGIDLMDLHQTHLWNEGSYRLKEPTNQEMEVCANLAVSYGVKGLLYFSYDGNVTDNGYNSDYGNNGTRFYYAGLGVDSNRNPRKYNAYGQNKWDFFKKYNRILEIWGPYLMSFDNVSSKSYINRFQSERSLMSANTFIKKLDAFPAFEFAPDPIPDLSNSTAEPNNSAYLQAAFFQKEYETEQNKYFMIVNRRCSPFIDYTSANKIGGRRLVTMKINPSNLPGFTNWKIYNLETGDTSFTFSKYDSVNSVFVGDFLPGEGKLYKLSPVMQEGGTLVADEEVSNIQFVCKSTVKNNGKNITIGSGTEIFFREGAGINMTGGNFICDGSPGNGNILLQGINREHWNGINLINTGSLTKIEKTIFESTKSPVVIDNSQFGPQYSQKIIRRNIFYITHDSGIALRIRNQFAILIDSNTFNVSNNNSTSGIYFSNYSDPGPAGGTPEDNCFVNITNNTFSGAYFPVLLNNLGTAYSSFYMYNNQFQTTGLFGITGMKITGTIKNNRFVNSTENYCIYLSLSNPDIYGNYFNSDKRNMVLTASYPVIAPIRNNNNQLIWKGGRNGFNVNQGNDTIAKENIYLKSSLPITDLGENSFSVPNSSSYHIFGSISSNDSSQTYLTKRNCWIGNNDIPKIFMYNPLDTPVIQIGYIFTPVICIPSENTSNEITEIGFGMYDTTFISEYDSTDILSEDEALYSEARELLSNGNHSEAITNFKALINEFHTSDYIYSSQDYLYESYRGLDTSENQEVTDILFSDLKQFLETKISIGHYDEDFDDNAYEIILMCEQKLENYNSALSGYEFISLYHPDAYRRIQASWEYDNIESILGGMGGGERDLEIGISDLEFDMNKRLKRINEFADNDPATGKIRRNYLKANAEKKANEEKKANRDFKESKTTNILKPGGSNENDDKLIERAKQNLFLSKRISKEEKERRRFEDLNLILNPDNLQAGQKETDNLIPVQYSLSQNYPNPFNPNTKFKFSLPVDSRVNITIYDLLGREVVKLINNDFRKAGVYTVEFTAKNLSSGVYFYRLDAGSFMQTKRMILLK